MGFGLPAAGSGGAAAPAKTYKDIVLADSPLFYLPLDDASGAAALDASGNGHDGSYQGGVTLGAAGPGGDHAAALNGTTGYVSIPDAASLRVSDVLTLEVWAYFAALPDVVGPLITKPSAWNFQLTPGGVVQFAGAGATPPVTGKSQWHHLAVAFDGTNVFPYFDGAFAGSYAGSISGTSQPILIGQRNDPFYFAGRLARAAAYHSVLPVERVSAHYLAGIGAQLKA